MLPEITVLYQLRYFLAHLARDRAHPFSKNQVRGEAAFRPALATCHPGTPKFGYRHKQKDFRCLRVEGSRPDFAQPPQQSYYDFATL
jgi:hypothetical protein